MDINAALTRRVKSPVTKPTKCTAPRKESPSKASSAVASLRSGAAKRKLLATASRTESSDEVQSSSSPKKPRTAASKDRATVTSASTFFTASVKAVSRTQAYIDVGQKGFGKYTTCKKCGLLYTVGEEQDEKEHQRFCKISQKGIVITKWKNERLLKTFPDETARIIEIRRGDPPTHVHKLMEIKSLLDDALGFVKEATFLQRSHYVYIHAKQVVGCTTVERIEKAFPLDPKSSNLVASSTTATKSSEDGNILATTPTSSNSHAVVAGICQIWVHPAFRCKKIATRLVDTVREKYIYGMRIAKHQVAFAQPTKNGRCFAEKYVAPHQVLVYDDISDRQQRNS
ncbi:N-acetyltransferase, partial [Globisporangium splendens]